MIGDGTSGKFKGIFYNPTETKDQVIDPATDLSMTAVDDGTLDEIIYSFGGDEDVEDAAVLVLNKKDLKAFAKLRDKQGRKVYTIVNHGTPARSTVYRMLSIPLVEQSQTRRQRRSFTAWHTDR